jgi:Ni/Fe-hydrogenase subunit HybB-like protein
MRDWRGRPRFSAREAHLLDSLQATSPRYYALVGALVAVIAWGLIAYGVQLRNGLGVTGLRDNVMWGVYITNFIFFIGVSHVGALMSAILRLTGAEWRRPITRMAEAITFASLLMGALMPFVDMGRPDRILNLFLHGRLQSPILWDIMSITTYLTGSTLFLFVPMIPDIALLRDHYIDGPAWRRRLYTTLALGWRNTPGQRHRLEMIMGVLAVLIIPIAISVHTVVSWIMAMTLRAGWNSTIFGPYFVSGALFSGAAAVITAMAAFRWAYHLEDYITERHFKRMGYLVITLAVIYAYFTFNEYWTPLYKFAAPERGYLAAVFSGPFAPLFWFTQIGGLLLPLLLLTLPTVHMVPRLRSVPLLNPRPAAAAVVAAAAMLVFASASGSPVAALSGVENLRLLAPWILAGVAVWLFVALLPFFRERPIAAAVIASLLINVGAWAKRFVIIVPTLQHPFLPVQRAPAGWAIYRPSWVEWSITAAALAGFALIYILFSKVFPIVSIWETRETARGPETATGEVAHAPAP